MNKFVNSFLLIVYIPTLFTAIIVGMELPLSIFKATGNQLPYRTEVFAVFGLIMFLLLMRRSIRRWMGARIVSRKARFKWNIPVSLSRRKRVGTYLLLELLIFALAGIALYKLTPEAWVPALVLVIGSLDSLVFYLAGRWSGMFRIGLSSKAIIVADREVLVLYLTGLRKVSKQQSIVFFDYTKDLQLTFPLECIPADQQDDFFELLRKNTDPNKVYFSL